MAQNFVWSPPDLDDGDGYPLHNFFKKSPSFWTAWFLAHTRAQSLAGSANGLLLIKKTSALNEVLRLAEEDRAVMMQTLASEFPEIDLHNPCYKFPPREELRVFGVNWCPFGTIPESVLYDVQKLEAAIGKYLGDGPQTEELSAAMMGDPTHSLALKMLRLGAASSGPARWFYLHCVISICHYAEEDREAAYAAGARWRRAA